MIPLAHCSGKTYAVLGLGKTGRAAADALIAAGANVLLWDDNKHNCAQLPVAQASLVQPYKDWDWAALDAVVLSPGIPFTHPAPHPVVLAAKQHAVRMTSDIELLCEAQPNATYVAITGTNGKSTTTALVGHILQQAGRLVQVGGNIGTPALAMQPLGADGTYVLELSSFQLDLLTATPFHVAVWLNISPDHLDRHGDIEGYIAAKKRIFAGQKSQQVAVVGVDDAYSEAVATELAASSSAPKLVPVSAAHKPKAGVWVSADGMLHAQDTAAPQQASLQSCKALRGQHNYQNAAAAYAACRALGVAHDMILSAMESFGGLAHRMQCIAQRGKVSFVNDSKATNADAAAKSLGTYEQIYWIAGGVAKAGGIDSLGAYFPRIQKAFLIGQAQDAFTSTLEGHVPTQRCNSLTQATQAAYAAAKAEGGVVLLAPACASFDQFASFEKRGEAFEQAVQALLQEEA